VSRDNVEFRTVHKESGFKANPGTLYPFVMDPPVSGRYVRILLTTQKIVDCHRHRFDEIR
jgi:hypothetical protein